MQELFEPIVNAVWSIAIGVWIPILFIIVFLIFFSIVKKLFAAKEKHKMKKPVTDPKTKPEIKQDVASAFRPSSAYSNYRNDSSTQPVEKPVVNRAPISTPPPVRETTNIYNSYFDKKLYPKTETKKSQTIFNCSSPKLEPVEPTKFQENYKHYQARTGNNLTSTLANKGSRGEMQTFFKLAKEFGFNCVFANVYLPIKNGQDSEIDLILITLSEIYIIENKNFSGTVYGNEFDNDWVQWFPSKQYSFTNPILQNKGHCYAFQSVFYAVPKERIVPLVVFNNLCKIKVTTTSTVVQRDSLLDYIRNRQIQATNYFSANDLLKMSEVLLRYSNVDDSQKERHIQYVNSKRQ